MPSASPGAPAPATTPLARVSFVLHASVLATLLAASSAPTPLYPHYQDQWDLSPLAVTAVFGAYALALLLALLTTGALSDHLGRRPVLVGALTAESFAMLLLAAADDSGDLIAARTLQGVATAVATSAAGAALLDLADPARPGRAALANSIAPAAGMAAGALFSTLLVRFASAPPGTVYLLLGALFTAQAVAVAFTVETAGGRHGAWRSLRPRLSVPSSARRALLRTGAGVAAVWALGGFYSSLGPALARTVAPHAADMAGGLLFFAVTTAAAATIWALRRPRPPVTVVAGCCALVGATALTLHGTHGGGLPALFGGAVLAGAAFGAVSQGALRLTLTRLPERDRAATLTAYYVLSYLSMSVPALAAGAAAGRYGLLATTHVYALTAALLAAAAVVTLTVIPSARATAPPRGADRP
ncbi:MFS transporter [Streptomyces sp. NPDC052701]|uniref:MFS transporter n=1 Tax=Streptomyces sp. NPDC052701 TaxID=3155533 RepID=UPI003441BE4A